MTKNIEATDAIKSAKKILMISGVMFFLAGAFCLLKNEMAQEYLSMDNQSVQIIGVVLMVIGCFDVFIFPRLIKTK